MRRAEMFLYKQSGETPSLCVLKQPPSPTYAKETGSQFRHGQGGKKTSTQKMRRYPRAVLVHALGILAVCVFASILIFIQYFLRADQWLFLEGGEKKAPEESSSPTATRGCYLFLLLSDSQNEILAEDSAANSLNVRMDSR